MTSCQVMSQWEFFTDLSSIRNSLLSAVHPSSIRTSVNHDEISQEWVSEGLASYTSHLRRPFVDRKTIRRFTTSLTSPPPSLVLASSQEMLRSTALSSFLTKFTASKIEIFKSGIVYALNVLYCCQNNHNGIMLLDYQSSSLPSFTPLVSHSRRAPAPLPNEIGSRTMTRRRAGRGWTCVGRHRRRRCQTRRILRCKSSVPCYSQVLIRWFIPRGRPVQDFLIIMGPISDKLAMTNCQELQTK